MNRFVARVGAGLVLLVCVQGAVWAEGPTLKLWPNGLPADAKPLPPERIVELKAASQISRVTVVEDPVMTVYRPSPEKANGAAVIVCPGGGYNILALDKEGIEIAEWFNSFGVTAVVLQYRVPRRDPDRPYWEPLQDAQRAVRLTRAHAEEWGIDPHRVGVLGFSAGGHLTCMTGMYWREQTYEPVDEADRLSCRPDFIMPIYAAYLGPQMDDSKPELGELVRIDKETPPAFMAVTADDKARGSLAALFFVELTKAGVPAEVHVFTKGGHGYGLRPSEHPVAQTWPKLAEAWMRDMGLLDPKK
ncbi:alpha/beta hydrolase [Thermostilla marina]